MALPPSSVPSVAAIAFSASVSLLIWTNAKPLGLICFEIGHHLEPLNCAVFSN